MTRGGKILVGTKIFVDKKEGLVLETTAAADPFNEIHRVK